jgi:hypothetical protein
MGALEVPARNCWGESRAGIAGALLTAVLLAIVARPREKAETITFSISPMAVPRATAVAVWFGVPILGWFTPGSIALLAKAWAAPATMDDGENSFQLG